MTTEPTNTEATEVVKPAELNVPTVKPVAPAAAATATEAPPVAPAVVAPPSVPPPVAEPVAVAPVAAQPVSVSVPEPAAEPVAQVAHIEEPEPVVAEEIPTVEATPVALKADEGEPLFTIQVWQLGVIVLGLLFAVSHFVLGTPLPAPSGYMQFKLAIKLVPALFLLVLLLVLKRRQQAA